MWGKLFDLTVFRKISKVQKQRSYSLFRDIFWYIFTITSFIMTCNYVIYIEMLRYTQQMMFFSSKGVVFKNLYWPNNFEPKILFGPTFFWTKFFLDLTQHCCGPNIFWTKQFLVRIFWSNKILGKKNWFKIILCPKEMGLEKTLSPSKNGLKKIWFKQCSGQNNI